MNWHFLQTHEANGRAPITVEQTKAGQYTFMTREKRQSERITENTLHTADMLISPKMLGALLATSQLELLTNAR